ncbi:DALR anticodon-binding domain-containing protein [Lyngbya aestuarii]|uniref:DALR anticodon-binding domain-containing protein n=1 Tax=Lyngbya aestuarii TaxID=118322 RepID=UPI00403D98BB
MGTTADLLETQQLKPSDIPLYRLSHNTCVIYRCAIALQLASHKQLRAIDFADQLTASFPDFNQQSASDRCLNFRIEVIPPGWISFQLSNHSLASWLQHLIQEPEQTKLKSLDDTSKEADNFFKLQYTHARCCSLLHLAHRQGLIKLRDADFSTPQGQILEPNPIPWLEDKLEEGTVEIPLRLVHPAECSLITQILDWQDGFSNQTHSNWHKKGNDLSEAFEKFYSHCRIWGEVKLDNPKLAQARFGLVAITQGLMRSLLQDVLSATAAVEL